MSNDDLVRGLVPVNLGQGNLSAHYYLVDSSADIYLGQPLILPAAGYAISGTTGNSVIAQYLGVAIGFAGTQKRGLATPDPFLDASDLAPPSPSSDTGDRYVLVADDPNQEFVIQEDTGGTAIALADINNSVGLLYRGTGNAVTGNADTGWATLEIDASSVSTGTANGLQILGLFDGVNSDGTNNAVGDFAKWTVKILHHQRGGAPTLPTA